jgi:hypothetical protein
MNEIVKKEDFYSCRRCNITSETKGRICPCPRGGCEAKITGTLLTTKTLITELSDEQIKWNSK